MLQPLSTYLFTESVELYAWTVVPNNTAAVAGTRATLQCTSDNAQSLNWMFTPTGSPPYVTIINACQMNPDYANRYALGTVGPGRCDLIALNVSLSDVWMYGCVAFDPTVSAMLAMLCEYPLSTLNSMNIGLCYTFDTMMKVKWM